MPPPADTAHPKPAPLIPAASVITLRDGPAGFEVLMIQRARTMQFAGGASAFPGGKIDPSDQPDGPQFTGFDALDNIDSSARVAAARELFEECGILLSEGPAADASRLHILRSLSDRHEISFAGLLQEIRHQLRAERLVPFARWHPPEIAPKRFDTHFYLAHADAETHADGHEAVRSRWATPKSLIAECRAGNITLLFPTRCNLERLALFPDVQTALADPTPAPHVRTRFEGKTAFIPEGIGYPYTQEQVAF